jgi:galactoside O-acetyltransferase
MKTLKKLMSDTARAPYPTNLSGRNVKNEHVDDRKNQQASCLPICAKAYLKKRLRGKTLMYEFNHSHPSEVEKG